MFLASAPAAAQQAELVIPAGHSGQVLSAVFIEKKQQVATAADDGTIIIWEQFSGKKVRSLAQADGPVRSMSTTPGGRYLLVQTDSSVYLWSLAGYEEVFHLRGVSSARVSPDDARVYVSMPGGEVRQYHITTKKREFSYPLDVRSAVKEGFAFSVHASGVLAIAGDSLVTFYQTGNGKLINQARPGQTILGISFTPGNRSLLIIGNRFLARLAPGSTSPVELSWNPPGKEMYSLSRSGVEYFFFSANREFLLVSQDHIMSAPIAWDLRKDQPYFLFDSLRSVYDTMQVVDDHGEGRLVTGTSPVSAPSPLAVMGGYIISDNGRYVRGMQTVWDLARTVRSFDNREFEGMRATSFSPDGKYLLASTSSSEVALISLDRGKKIQRYHAQAHDPGVFQFSPDNQTLALANSTHTVKIIDVKTGTAKHILRGHRGNIMSVSFSPDGQFLLTNSKDSSAILWDLGRGKMVRVIDSSHWDFNPSYFNEKGVVVTPKREIEYVERMSLEGEVEDTIIVSRQVNSPVVSEGRSRTGKFSYTEHSFMSRELKGVQVDFPGSATAIAFSSSEKFFAWINAIQDTLMIVDLASGKLVYSHKSGLRTNPRFGFPMVERMLFTPDDRYLVLLDGYHQAHFFSLAEPGISHAMPANALAFSPGGNLAAMLNEAKLTLYTYPSWKPLYSYLTVTDDDYLVMDHQRRFDGTRAGRELLYYSCGDEIVELSQLKDKLWVPNLAERIMSGDSIYAAGISSLRICGIAPRVREEKPFSYLVTPGEGGLGEITVQVNFIETMRFTANQLQREGANFRLKLDRKAIEAYYESGKENTVTVRAYTRDNTMASRGLVARDSTGTKNAVSPNLYAVMVGISDYKGETLDLKYAAKDANDLGEVLEISARKLFNGDGGEHVFIYRLTTGAGRNRMPEKEAIRRTLLEIGQKANPNDVLLVFFAGHGIISGEEKKFFFLTAEASGMEEHAGVAAVGISTQELAEWIRPSVMKAQKRILIFDACNSGQAIRDMVKVGGNDQGYIAARNEERSRQAKLIEKLNERSGFTILSAAASNQSAYEMGKYAQGLLTYALLKSVREQPSILDQGRFLDILRWFQATQSTVEALLDNSGARQQPELISNTSFAIGVVDEQVMSQIRLPAEKPVFASSLIVNMDGYSDDLRLSRQVNRMLADMASDNNSGIVYAADSELEMSYLLNGKYKVTGNLVALEIDLYRGKLLSGSYRIEGDKNNLEALISRLRSYIEEYLKQR